MRGNMKKRYAVSALFGVCVAASVSSAWAGPLREAVKDTAGFVGDTVADTAKSVGKTVEHVSDRITGDLDYAKWRREIDATEAKSMKRLFATAPKAKSLFDQSYGYAVFDSRKSAFLLTTGSGAGVAVAKGSGKRTYMRMASLGANLGAGMQFYQSIILFETERAFDSFITSGWEANTEADAVVGKAGALAEVKFNDGMAFYNLADSGALVSVSVAGTKYWVSEDLNKKG
jgi:lipid-binding SYLF domain-containing protein